MGTVIKLLLTRGAWLMLGAAIGVAAAILGGSLGAAATPAAIPVAAVLGVLVVAAGVALLPGVGEIEATAAHTLLGIPAERVSVPAGIVRPWWRTAAWTTAHATLGLLSGFSVIGVLPGGVVTLTWALTGTTSPLQRVGLDWSSPVAALAGIGMVAQAPLVVAGLGWVAASLGPRLLGPTSADRLAVTEARLAAERRHTVLARELHDGIGHALSIISVQSAAARRVADRHPDRALAALHVIEQTSREAQGELDHLLGLLRDPDADPGRYRISLDDLPALVARHRDAGLTIDCSNDATDVPRLISGSAADIVAEALANAQRHATGQPVTVRVTREAGDLVVTVRNPLPARPSRSRNRIGHGVLGLRERAALLDGTLTAGPVDDEWLVRATLPLGAARPEARP